MTPNVIVTRCGPALANYSRKRPESIVACAQSGQFARAGRVVKVVRRPVFYAVLAMVASPGTIVHANDMLEAAYGDDPEGGPLSIMSTVIVPDMKVAAAAIGFEIKRHGNQGWSAHDMLLTEAT